ncbi:GrpB family protein [Archangium violaceum]|uniref:GrpB family protein n=1 Tax=Archangium violaceum TaxID=83451 RepID=UPI002B2F82A5|nr:GrpB family protein [Archangium violaceum]
MKTPEVDEPITLVEPDPQWPALYASEAERVRGVLGAVVTRIEHVGSTAVPGLVGKPIVDLLVGVRSLDEGKTAAPRLVALGYEDFGEVLALSAEAGATRLQCRHRRRRRGVLHRAARRPRLPARAPRRGEGLR